MASTDEETTLSQRFPALLKRGGRADAKSLGLLDLGVEEHQDLETISCLRAITALTALGGFGHVVAFITFWVVFGRIEEAALTYAFAHVVVLLLVMAGYWLIARWMLLATVTVFVVVEMAQSPPGWGAEFIAVVIVSLPLFVFRSTERVFAGATMLGLVGLFAVSCWLMHRQDPPFSDLHPNFWEVYYTLAGVFATIALGALATLKASLLRLSQRLEEQRDSSQGLLESLFPSRVVERLRSGERRIADARPEATIVFVDLVGFTAVSERVGPSHLIELLENIFWHIDEAAERHGVEKIKTVGDAYMAAAGVTREPTPHDAEMCANFALEVIELIPLISTTVGYEMQARAGIHNGPVIAGIMGKAKTVYDVWGSAVNLASRLESTAGANEILISEPAYWRLQDSFYCEAVGKTDLKGRGPTDVYRLMGKRRDTKPRAPAPDEPQDNVVQLHQAAPNAQGDTQ